MMKTEKRVRSISFTGSSTRSAPLLTRPILLHGEAETLLRKVPTINELIIREEDEDDLQLKPWLPEVRNAAEEKKSNALEKLMCKFHMTDAHLLHIEKRMLDEINRGLLKTTNASANIKSFITYVHDLPTGRESGKYLALDLGGTNFRVLLLQLEEGSRSIQTKSSKHQVSKRLMHGPAEELFDFLAECLHDFLFDHNLIGTEIGLGFTFSFPTRQRGLDSAELVTWTKGFVCDGAVGHDVVKLMQDAIDRRKVLTGLKINALINDTTGCLLACAYKRPDCAISCILGTGTNASYVEDMALCEMYEGERPRRRPAVVINTEWGAFGNTGSLDIVRTQYDLKLDRESVNPSKQVYEKLISGMYLGELVRLILVDAVEKGIIFDGQEQGPLLLRGKFETRFVSEIESDDRIDFRHTRAVMDELNIPESAYTTFDLWAVRYICECVSTRAADLAGAGIASLVNKIGRRRVTVGMDGSLYKFHPHLGRKMEFAMKRLVNDSIKFELALSEDGSGRGAALAAAVAVKLDERKKKTQS